MFDYGLSGLSVIGGLGGSSAASPRQVTGQHDRIIGLDIPDHGYVDSYFQAQVEQMAGEAKLLRRRGSGFYNDSGYVDKMLSIDMWSPRDLPGPSSYPGGKVLSHWWASAWVKGESAGWFQPLKLPRHVPTWLQITGLTWFFGENSRYESNIVWCIRNGIQPNHQSIFDYEKISQSMLSALKSLA